MPTLASAADTRSEVLALASDVMACVPTPARATLTARMAARILTGVAAVLSRARRGGQESMRAAFYALAAHAPAWSSESPLHALPTVDGYADPDVVLIAAVASGMVPDFGLHNVRAAVAFWATETDPAIWQHVAAA